MIGPLKIWTNAGVAPDAREVLIKGVGEHELVFSSQMTSNLSGGHPSPEMENADVVFGQPSPEQLLDLPTLKYIQITSAGYTRYDKPEFKAAMKARGIPFCNSSSVYDDACAQHVLAFMLSTLRQIPQSVRAQDCEQKWAFETLRPVMRTLKGDNVLIVGYGAIAKRLVELLAPFEIEIVALRRTPRGDEPVPTFKIGELKDRLSNADHVVNILPAGDDNYQIFNADMFGSMKPSAHFYNIGRGTTVDQVALGSALNEDCLTSALLDVTDPEPLPSDNPLWKAKNLTITPHIAGGFQNEEITAVQHFLANLKRFEAGEPLKDQVF